jgi:hypothetical protein
MANKHSFTSSVSQKVNLESKLNYAKSFTSKIINSQIFTSILDGFASSPSWLIKFIANQNINVNKINTKTKIYANFISNNLNIFITNISIVFSMKPTFYQNSIIRAIMRLKQRMGNILVHNDFSIYARIREKLNIKSTQFNSTEAMTATITSQKYYLVSDWDSYLLSDLDSMTLQDMDYQVV